MTMRFNGRELAYLAQLPAEKYKYDREGLLQIKEKQEGIFRKGEVYVARWFRLRGNLLFYFKTKDPTEPIGVLVLERCTVELDPDEELPFSFVLVFEGEEKVQHLGASSEQERASWIESLHIASYECMRMQLQSLREQLRSRTGKDPIDNPDPSVLPEYKPGEPVETQAAFLELCIACDGLPCAGHGKMPNSLVSISYATPPNQAWTAHAHTEIVERQTNPVYITTIGFSNPTRVNLQTKIRLIIYDVKERMTGTVQHRLSNMAQIGLVHFTIADLLSAPGNRLRLPLNSQDFSDAGHVTVSAWQNEPGSENDMINGNQESQDSEICNGVDAALAIPLKGKTKRLDMLKPLYANILTKTYRLPTNSEGNISVHEYMGESKLTYALPIQLLKLWVEEEKCRIENLQDLGELVEEWDSTRKELMDFHMSTISMYTQSARYLMGYKGAPFKPSAKKGHKEVEFAPTNLHIHRMWVQNTGKKKKVPTATLR